MSQQLHDDGGIEAVLVSERVQEEVKTFLKTDLGVDNLRDFVTIAKGEKSIERQRQVLATLQKFEPHSAFQRINRDQSGKISSMEILKFLRDNGVEEATEADTYYIVKYFDSNDDELLEYDDLLQMVMPCDD